MSKSNSRLIPSKPHFFKPLLPGFDHEFSIPVSFFKYLKEQEYNKAMLRSRGGKLWPVNIKGRRFENGWKQFAQDHELHVGDFLVFRHEGDLVFDVLVFDPTACEREYPPFTIKEEIENIEFQDQEIASHSPTGKISKKKQATTRLEARAKSSVLEHPYYVIKLTPYSVKHRVHIPMNFAREHGLYKISCEIILKDEEGSSWPAKAWCKKSDGQVYIGAGWIAFLRSHHLKAGDSLIFELIMKGKRPVLKIRRLDENPEVTKELTYHNAESGTPSLEYTPSLEQSHLHANITTSNPKNSQPKVPEAIAKEFGSWKPNKKKPSTTALGAEASSSVLQHPFFVAKVTRHACPYRMYIPAKFARRHLQSYRCSQIILIDQKGRSWPANLLFRRSDRQAYIANGWKAFCAANALKLGDSFIFELIEKGKIPILKMFEFKASSKVLCQDVEAGSSSIRHPHFYVIMKASYFNQHILKIQRNFARWNGLTGKCSKIILKNEKGNTWKVSLNQDKDGGLIFGDRWFEFVKENGLQEGDVFMLELVQKGTRPTMKFYAVKQEMA